MSKKVKILDQTQIKQKLDRLAYQVYENNFGEKSIFIVGIEGNGHKMAALVADRLRSISGMKVDLGKISLDKDEPWNSKVKIDFNEKDFKDKPVILVDDVLNSGKTLIYAVKLFLDKPLKKLSTVVLVDRSHARYPVKADFVGLTLSTTLQERIEADFSKKGNEVVYLI